MDSTFVDERTGIKAGLDAWVEAVELGEMSRLPQVVSQDADLVWIGPGAPEWITGYEALEQAMLAQDEALKEIHIQVSEETIHHTPGTNSAWATNCWLFSGRMGDQTLSMPLRCTWILEKRQDRWVIVHFHKSAGIPS